MNKIFLGLVSALLCIAGCKSDNVTNEPVTVTQEQLKEAFYYTFPLVLMDETMSTETNVVEWIPGGVRAPINQLNHASKLATADSKWVVTPNVDTYYSRLWMDLSKEPLVLEFPNVTDRFCNIQVLDAWTNTCKVIYSGGTYVFALQGQKVNTPAGATLVELPTSMAWAIVRILNKGEGDYANVKQIQDAMKAYPLSAYNKGNYQPSKGTYDPSKDTNPVQRTLALSLEDYFAKANALMQKNAPLSFDTEISARLKMLGVGPGLTLKTIVGGKEMFAAIKANFRAEAVQIAAANRKCIGDIWAYFADPIGNFGQAYDFRAAVALVGLGANTTDVAIYPRANNGSDGVALNGKNTYVMHFSSLPPVMELGFWSVTAYGEDNYLIANPINRYNVTDRSAYTLNPDGSLDITLSATAPKDGTYWLPTGDKEYHLFMRLYLPNLQALDSWTPPTITKK
ncbi:MULTISPECIES: DUF1254 domain-containing protein [Bacteroidales]|nr:DUF1254 domain-containing protein [Bacteroides heparinolyticus]MCI6213317.1 DUF1254 domain-containing protein [Bacteroides heparinolyticus]